MKDSPIWRSVQWVCAAVCVVALVWHEHAGAGRLDTEDVAGGVGLAVIARLVGRLISEWGQE